MKKLVYIVVFFILITLDVYAQSNGVYKSEYGFTLIIKNYKKNDSFSFTLSGHLQDKNCACFEISGKAFSDPLDEENNANISYQFFQDNSNGESEPYVWFEGKVDKILISFPEGTTFCGNCFEVDTIYKKVLTQHKTTYKKTAKSNFKSVK